MTAAGGLQLMILTGVECKEFASALDGANELGVVLQKIHIISDYHEDITADPLPRYMAPLSCFLSGHWQAWMVVTKKLFFMSAYTDGKYYCTANVEREGGNRRSLYQVKG